MSSDHVDVLIVGAGLSGIGAGHYVQAECPWASYAIFEARGAIGGKGGATPVVCEPSPSFCKVFASSFPVAFRPCASWNFFVASTVESSHLPLGVPLKEPSFASAC